ncbi:BTB/POZ domain protein [Rhizoctonia solani 123E]|uniref:BTB/POZ domain protein n=1 Tax=Rhizoctonia solani 123E TaxID=1423351 RepID=A0A074RZI8_9AGAM|nr:BTB/POZ domain protein [Rhizoctonia solani 123E]
MTEKNSAALITRVGRWVLLDEVSGAKTDGKLTPCFRPRLRDQAQIVPSKYAVPQWQKQSHTIPSSSLITSWLPFRSERHCHVSKLTDVPSKVENTLFNVHKYQLAKSEIFSDMFKLPKAEEDGPEEGSSPEHPIVMKGVAASDFAALLTFLYANQFSGDQPTPEVALIIPAFRLAHMFSFSELRKHLLSFAEEHLDDIDKIVFATEFDIKEWLAPAHIRLCQRQEALSIEEAGRLGIKSVLMISHMREQHRNRNGSLLPTNYYCYACSGMTYHNNGFTCRGCNNTHGFGYLRYNGPGKLAQNGGVTVDVNAIEADVKQWVEEVYTVKSS